MDSKRVLATAALLAAAGLMSACATVETLSTAERGSPRFFSGTRLDVATLSGDSNAMTRFDRYDMAASPYPALDLPLSFAADVVMLPAVVGFTLTGMSSGSRPVSID